MAACDICHRRKVRCDSEGGAQCSTCRNGRLECTFILAEQHKVRRRQKRSLTAASSVASHSGTQNLIINDSRDTHLPDHHPRPVSLFRPTAEGSITSNQSTQPPQSFVPTIDDIAEEELSRTALTEFYQHGITGDSPWFTYKDGKWIRIAYIGTATSNLTHLVQGELAAHRNLHAPSLHLPFPSIRPNMPWKPQKDQPIVRWYSKMTDDAGALPAKEVRDEMVEAFFKKIHPGFPIVDEAQFRSQYADPENPPPLLLLQSVLLAGAHVCQHPKVTESRALVKMTLFRRAKALFDMHFENDRMNLVQAALLFCWHFEGPDDCSANAYYWVGVACRIAFGLGMHRDLGPNTSTRMPAGDTRIYRRIFWTLAQMDVLSSLHHGRPPMIDPDECDQAPLLADDFIEYCERRNENVDIEYNIQNANLCKIILSIIKFSSPGSLRRCASMPNSLCSQQKSLDSRLVGWYLRLPPCLAGLSSNRGNFLALQLQLHYNLALIHLHRIPAENRSPEEHFHKSSSTCHTAALSIAKIFDNILAADFTERCCFTGLTSLLSAAIQMSSEARTAVVSGDMILALQAQTRLEGLLPAIKSLSTYWPSAEAITNIFQDVLLKLKEQCKAAYIELEPTSGISSTSGGHLDPGLIGDHDNSHLGNEPRVGNSSIEWSNFFEMGDVDPFADIEALGLESWLTMPTSGNRFSEQ